MNNYKVYGIENISFADKQTGEMINLVRFYLGFKSDKVEGVKVEIVTCSPKKVSSDIKVNDNVFIYYNKYGKVELIDIIK